MANRWIGATVDCVDVERVAGFRSALPDRPPTPPGRAGSTSAGPTTRSPASPSGR
ncbi:hypothetical protein SAMN05216223_105462 [Actinacidiphila yanglinensis]|uniref:Uncharacterized protein n=1 Tax=Actinacidiphila yanglinensis TaxID=310779 RepID=A0A1H6AKC7_9ACTN|nr:hypothetical protein SAMN05216223_105462 [Actinacidiphila yanglinensis]